LDGAVPCGGVVAADAGQRRQTPKNSCASLNYYYVASGIVREVVEGGVMCVCKGSEHGGEAAAHILERKGTPAPPGGRQ
jgi:hypothetical protein